MRVHLNDEAPRIGSGWREVEVLSSGWKWVVIRCPHTLSRKRLPKSLWAAISRGQKS